MLSENMQRLSQAIKTKFVRGPLIWLAIRLGLFVYKRSLKLELLLFNKLKYQLRLSNPDFHSEGFDEHFDKLVHIAALKLSSPEIFDLEANKFLFQGYPDSLIQKYLNIKREYEKNKNDIDQLVDLALKNPRIRITVEKHSLVKGFSSIQRKDEKASKYYLALARRYNQDASVIDVKRLFEVDEETKKELRDLKHEISDREAIKVAFSLTNIGAFVSVVSTFFLVTGYLYNNFLLGHFGIEVSKYFSLSDYLASSIEGVRYSASGAVIGLVFYFIGMHNASRKSYAQIAIERKRKDYWPYIILTATVTAALKSYLDDTEQFYNLAYMSVLVFTFIVAPWISKRYFKEPIIALFSIIFVSTFTAHMYESVGKEIYRLEHKSIEELRRYDISFKDNLPFDPSNVVLIAANSNHLFLLARDRKIYIVPRSQINYVMLDERK